MSPTVAELLAVIAAGIECMPMTTQTRCEWVARAQEALKLATTETP